MFNKYKVALLHTGNQQLYMSMYSGKVVSSVSSKILH